MIGAKVQRQFRISGRIFMEAVVLPATFGLAVIYRMGASIVNKI